MAALTKSINHLSLSYFKYCTCQFKGILFCEKAFKTSIVLEIKSQSTKPLFKALRNLI